MRRDSSSSSAHRSGEQSLVVAREPPGGVDLDSFFGPVRVEWDHEAAMTVLGQLPFFIDFLKKAGLFDALVADCPLRYLSPNAPSKRDVLGTAMLSMLAGHKRYAHIAALRCDAVLPELLGMRKIVSEDAIRRAFKAIDETEGAAWVRRHLQYCVEPLLAEPWILDVDTTVKPLYGHQEGAVLGYNPKKPGRPSHCYHTYSMASTRLVLDVDVSPGDEHASKHSAPGLWGLLDRLPRDLWPALLRGDRGFGNEEIMREAEARELPFLLKLRLTANVKRMIEKLASSREWVDAGQGFRGQGERGSAGRLEPPAARDRAQATPERRRGGSPGRRWRAAAACVRRDRRGERTFTNTRFWSPRSMKTPRRSVSSIATGAMEISTRHGDSQDSVAGAAALSAGFGGRRRQGGGVARIAFNAAIVSGSARTSTPRFEPEPTLRQDRRPFWTQV